MKERRETYNKQQVYAKKKKKLPTPLLPYSLLSALSANTHTHTQHTHSSLSLYKQTAAELTPSTLHSLLY